MQRKTFVIFGIVAVFLAVIVPAWALSTDGSESSAPEAVPADLETGKDLFVTNCGACHTLYKAGTDGVVAPNLDELLAPPGPVAPDPDSIYPRVLSSVNNGVGGRMPAGILSGQQAEEVSWFVAKVAGKR
ncbi:MAG: c-type cytochrome [bacterium]|jgi:mono/diheme cytochrome c family protein